MQRVSIAGLSHNFVPVARDGTILLYNIAGVGRKAAVTAAVRDEGLHREGTKGAKIFGCCSAAGVLRILGAMGRLERRDG